MSEVFKDIPEIFKNNFHIALKCNYFPREIDPKLPKFSNDLSNFEDISLLLTHFTLEIPSDICGVSFFLELDDIKYQDVFFKIG